MTAQLAGCPDNNMRSEPAVLMPCLGYWEKFSSSFMGQEQELGAAT